jgi:hypothetical protein
MQQARRPLRCYHVATMLRVAALLFLMGADSSNALSSSHPSSSSSSSSSSSTSIPDETACSRRTTVFPNSVSVTSLDLATLIRQTGQINPSKAAIGVPAHCLCQHGFPQAFALDPLHAGRMNSGLVKLTCPLLVKAVDALEDEGLMETLLILQDNRVGDDKSLLLQDRKVAHRLHAQVRTKLLHSTELDTIRQRLGDKGTQAFLEAGVAGSSPDSSDIKCLHAWLAHHLFISPPPTKIGSLILNELETRAVNVTGTPQCRGYCDPTCSSALANPPKPRNKQRLRTRKETVRRKRRRKHDEQQQT